ncbi:hypothetical protein ERJ75_000683200 [Trypanosoma vivax]|uniref:Uncharacterized protein n=1 Tax=Trypanosoma vivax (strain Y486) TaxID=1055687 RepID=F9WLA6_TRYVY|nr:hypothetical protein ERJ75_000682600 [Trypanosoma vivax]KAH8614523.1 hypothetical protein ERJ75_000683200 [Trypanosoma vivax]CCD18294.1 hypothetical protein, conserved [Trypanosoma vivax Y486]|eukprot:CCD18294.1 hypothetical protein, conserved [Trypanosoma vivax Y486]
MRRCAAALSPTALAAVVRGIIQSVKPAGVSLTEIGLKLKEHMSATMERGTVGRSVEAPSVNLEEVLKEVNDAHCLCDSVVYPCDWAAVVRNVAGTMPWEGLIEADLIHRLLENEPRFQSAEASLGEPLCQWMSRHFHHIIRVSRSVTRGVPIYRVREEAATAEAAAIHNALQLLGRGNLPVYTDFALIAPHLPGPMSPAEGGWMRFLEQESVSRHFDVRVDVSVRLAPGCSPTSVCVDGTSVDVSRISEFMREKGLSQSVCSVKVFRRADDPAWSTDDVVMQGFLDPEHVIGAAIASLCQRDGANVYVVCAESAQERYKAALADLMSSSCSGVTLCALPGVALAQ